MNDMLMLNNDLFSNYAYFAVNFQGVEVLICKVDSYLIGSFDV